MTEVGKWSPSAEETGEYCSRGAPPRRTRCLRFHGAAIRRRRHCRGMGLRSSHGAPARVPENNDLGCALHTCDRPNVFSSRNTRFMVTSSGLGATQLETRGLPHRFGIRVKKPSSSLSPTRSRFYNPNPRPVPTPYTYNPLGKTRSLFVNAIVTAEHESGDPRRSPRRGFCELETDFLSPSPPPHRSSFHRLPMGKYFAPLRGDYAPLGRTPP